jgi:hypothetical protein
MGGGHMGGAPGVHVGECGEGGHRVPGTHCLPQAPIPVNIVEHPQSHLLHAARAASSPTDL